MATKAQSRLEQVKTFVSGLCAELPPPAEGMTFATPALIRRKKLATITQGCGSAVVRAELLALLQQEFEAAGVHTHRPLTSASFRRDDWVRLSRVPFAPDELFFENEQLLREYLAAAIGNFGPFRDLEREEREFSLPSRRRIDILCRERRRDGQGALVAIELKKAGDADGVVTQLGRYLEQLAEHPLAQGREVRGIIVSGRADEIEARHLTPEHRFRIDWYSYRVSFDREATTRPGTKGA